MVKSYGSTPKSLPDSQMDGVAYSHRVSAEIVVGGIPFQVANLASAVDECVGAALAGKSVSIRLANAYCVALASRETEYKAVLCGPGMNYPDGAPVAFMMRRREPTQPSARRVRGPSLFQNVIEKSNGLPVRHYFLGGTPETLEALVRRIRADYPGVLIAGSFSPPFGPVTDSVVTESVEKIKRSGANLLWVGMGTPKQDFLTSHVAEALEIPCIGVGAAFDFFARTAREAPVWIQRSGFEWLFRLVTEPRRLWRRYLVGNMQFLATVLKDSK